MDRKGHVKLSVYRRLTAVVALVVLQPIELCFCWQNWNYLSFSSGDWRELWLLEDGPGERKGHSLVLFGETKIVLFGGRGNEVHRQHVPKRYNVLEKRGVLQFDTYNEVPLSSSYTPDSLECRPAQNCFPLTTNGTSGNEEVCTYSWEHTLQDIDSSRQQEKIEEECGFVPVGVHYNDVWIYDTDCLRHGDHACVDDGWKVVHPGMKFGGCNIENGTHVCKAPSERYGHGASMLDASTMVIYGGYSHECEDYCDDLWLFDLASSKWIKQHNSSNPGKRWKFSMVGDANVDGANIFLFGGHRLWHGFSGDNSMENRWRHKDVYPDGGYLNDLWIYSNNQYSEGKWQWSKIKGKRTCIDAPGLTWESRNDKSCEIRWPMARSGHAAVYDSDRKGIWIHGGFSTYYPYPKSNDSGSSSGVQTLGRDHDPVYHPTFKYFLDDLWFYDVESGYWEKKRGFGKKPNKRTDHIIFLSGNRLILHGGYADNYYYNDTWHYIIEENRWIEKVDFVHADFPDGCVDDLSAIEKDADCIELQFPPELRRSNSSTLALKYKEILPFNDQSGYTPDSDDLHYFGVVDDAEEFVKELRKKYLQQELYDKEGQRIWLESTIPDGTPIAPNAATGPRQYARQKNIKFNATTELKLWEWCIAGKGEPTRGRSDNGEFGGVEKSIFIPQPRRQAPGWDGCREVQWKYPPSRSDHASVFVEKYNILVVHGGVGYNPNIPSPLGHETDSSPDTQVFSDLWVLNMHNCARNCSNSGVCTNGFCKCDPGYYGVDCSNYTCPGSICHYDEDHVEHCTHCCFDNKENRKIPCRLNGRGMEFTGRSEGLCDGFGTCQCAPPYIGEDCSILDCKQNCNFNGYCSIEFPESRCLCKDGYSGEYCQHFDCLNNCSYPNGVCDYETGKCKCRSLVSPYDRGQVWDRWHGEDCSYLPVWSKAHTIELHPSKCWFFLAIVLSL